MILLEDFAALIGLVFALFGVGLTLITGNPVFDVIGTTLIGLLLVTVAVVLAAGDQEPAARRGGQPRGAAADRGRARGVPGIDGVIHMRTLHLGPDELLVAAKIAVTASDSAAARRARRSTPPRRRPVRPSRPPA